jgi:hypothetical protein
MKQQTAVDWLAETIYKNHDRSFLDFYRAEIIQAKEMEKLSTQNKINILQTLLLIIEKDHPEFKEENTTGWDVIENAKIWLQELK